MYILYKQICPVCKETRFLLSVSCRKLHTRSMSGR